MSYDTIIRVGVFSCTSALSGVCRIFSYDYRRGRYSEHLTGIITNRTAIRCISPAVEFLSGIFTSVAFYSALPILNNVLPIMLLYSPYIIPTLAILFAIYLGHILLRFFYDLFYNCYMGEREVTWTQCLLLGLGNIIFIIPLLALVIIQLAGIFSFLSADVTVSVVTRIITEVITSVFSFIVSFVAQSLVYYNLNAENEALLLFGLMSRVDSRILRLPIHLIWSMGTAFNNLSLGLGLLYGCAYRAVAYQKLAITSVELREDDINYPRTYSRSYLNSIVRGVAHPVISYLSNLATPTLMPLLGTVLGSITETTSEVFIEPILTALLGVILFGEDNIALPADMHAPYDNR